MKVVELILSAITVFLAVLGLMNVFSFDINPIVLTLLATVVVLRGIESKNKGDKKECILMILTALFVYGVVIYNTFIG